MSLWCCWVNKDVQNDIYALRSSGVSGWQDGWVPLKASSSIRVWFIRLIVGYWSRSTLNLFCKKKKKVWLCTFYKRIVRHFKLGFNVKSHIPFSIVDLGYKTHVCHGYLKQRSFTTDELKAYRKGFHSFLFFNCLVCYNPLSLDWEGFFFFSFCAVP